MQVVEDAYRNALAGAVPGLLKKATDREFRLFVEEMFELLTESLNGCSLRGPATFSRRDILEIIATLILNAAPRAKEAARRGHHASNIRLWATLVSLIPERVGTVIEETSIRWPAALRRRFLSGLYYRKRKRWPYTPFRRAALLGKPVQRAEVAKVYGLRSPGSNVANGLSSI